AGGGRALRVGVGEVLYAFLAAGRRGGGAAGRRIVAYSPSGEARVVARNVDVSDMAVGDVDDLFFGRGAQDDRAYRCGGESARGVSGRGDCDAEWCGIVGRPGDAGGERCAGEVQLVVSDWGERLA